VIHATHPTNGTWQLGYNLLYSRGGTQTLPEGKVIHRQNESYPHVIHSFQKVIHSFYTGLSTGFTQLINRLIHLTISHNSGTSLSPVDIWLELCYQHVPGTFGNCLTLSRSCGRLCPCCCVVEGVYSVQYALPLWSNTIAVRCGKDTRKTSYLSATSGNP